MQSSGSQRNDSTTGGEGLPHAQTQTVCCKDLEGGNWGRPRRPRTVRVVGRRRWCSSRRLPMSASPLLGTEVTRGAPIHDGDGDGVRLHITVAASQHPTQCTRLLPHAQGLPRAQEQAWNWRGREGQSRGQVISPPTHPKDKPKKSRRRGILRFRSSKVQNGWIAGTACCSCSHDGKYVWRHAAAGTWEHA